MGHARAGRRDEQRSVTVNREQSACHGLRMHILTGLHHPSQSVTAIAATGSL